MKDPIPTFTYLVRKIKESHPDLAWIHVVEPRVTGHDEREILPGEVCCSSLLSFPDLTVILSHEV